MSRQKGTKQAKQRREKAHGSKQATREAKQSRGSVKIVMLPLDRLRANPWNPNTMTAAQQTELLEEVRSQGRIAKPITVRPLRKDSYQILDGQHGWDAAREAGLSKVPCEIILADDFEAMRQIYVRNLQGTRDALLTGRLFQRMLELRGVSLEGSANSLRQFARENHLNEATLRNYLLYARAAEARKHYAPETGDATISEMSVAAVRQYLSLPEDRRDEWLDRGARSDEAAAILAEAGTKSKGSKKQVETCPPEPSADIGTAGEPTVVNGDDEDAKATCVEGRPADCTPVIPEHDKPAEPLSPAEQEVVHHVLESYQRGRAQVRRKILGGLGAYPDAVNFFRRMIKGGS